MKAIADHLNFMKENNLEPSMSRRDAMFQKAASGFILFWIRYKS